MGYDVEQIKTLENPYQELGNGDALAEHREELNKLNKTEQIDLATRMILNCPGNELKNFEYALKSIIPHHLSEESQDHFHATLSRALVLKKRLHSLNDPKNKSPHRVILGDEMDVEHLNEFNALVLHTLKDEETSIAQRLIITTPANQHPELKIKIATLFPHSELNDKVSEAIELHHAISDLLLGEDPKQFFLHENFSLDTCIEFSELMGLFIDGREKEIGEKLANANQSELSKISKLLSHMNPSALIQDNSFQLIASAMSAQLEKPVQVELQEKEPEIEQSEKQHLIEEQIQLEEEDCKSVKKPAPLPLKNASNPNRLFTPKIKEEEEVECCSNLLKFFF